MNEAALRRFLSSGIGGKNRELDASRVEQDIELMIRHSVDATGQPYSIRMLESGLGDFGLFCQEVREGETAVMVTIDEPVPRLLTFSEKVQIEFIVGDYEVVELWRRYERKDNLIVPTTTRKVIQGTLKRGEGIKTGGRREVREECEITLGEDELSILWDPKNLSTTAVSAERRRESSVYPSVLRAELRHTCRVVRDNRPWDYKETPPDNGVVVCFAFKPRASI